MSYHDHNHFQQRRAIELQAIKSAKQAAFVERSRDFWCNHGQRAIDYAVIIMVPTLLFAPAYVAWL